MTVAGVVQDPWIIDGSIIHNINLNLPGLDREVAVEACRSIGFDLFVEQLPDCYDHSVDGLSRGQRRRLALARAIARNPGILVMEEPTSDLDGVEQYDMMAAIEAAADDRTMIVLSGCPKLARSADAVFALSDGQLVPVDRASQEPMVTSTDEPSPAVGQRSRHRLPVHLRLADAGERRPPPPVTGSWGITIGAELIPNHQATGLLSRNRFTETWAAWRTEDVSGRVPGRVPVRVKVPRLPADRSSATRPQSAAAANLVSYQSWEQLRREYQILAEMKLTSTTAALDLDLESPMPYATFEYLDSMSLAEAVHQVGGLGPVDATTIGLAVATTLEQFHQHGYVHLDLRTSQIRTRGETIVITDASFCRAIGSVLPSAADGSGPSAGSGGQGPERCFAPEQQPGTLADPAMDVYALGTLVGRTLRNTRPGSKTGAPTANIPRRLATLLQQMTEDLPAARPSMAEVVDRLGELVPDHSANDRAPSHPQRHLRLVHG